jgi:predicted ATPase
MKVCIVGSFGTGKSTLYKELEKNPKVNQEFEFITETARFLIDTQGYNPRYFDDELQMEFQHKVFNRQSQEELKNKDKKFITDRGVLDGLTYAENIADQEFLKMIKKKAFDFNAKYPYDLIIYLPIEFELEDEGTRKDEKEQLVLDKRLIKMLNYLGLGYVTVTGSVQQRVNKVLELLGLE